jgi:hypothetical protein
MRTLFSHKPLPYDGTQLQSHFAYRQFGILGDSCVGFIGPCEVKLEHMVDLEDVRKTAPIFSQQMLHFILESFSLDLHGAIAFQRLMIAILQELLLQRPPLPWQRRGNDLFLNDRKLNVSIATASPVSSLIHTGINIISEGTPVPTVGLKELELEPFEFGNQLLKKIQEEYLGLIKASYKVRAVP